MGAPSAAFKALPPPIISSNPLVARDVVGKAALVPAYHAVTARTMEAHMVAQVNTAQLAVKEVEMAAVMGRGRPAKPEGDHSSPTSAHIRMIMGLIPMASIKRQGCRSKGAPSI